MGFPFLWMILWVGLSFPAQFTQLGILEELVNGFCNGKGKTLNTVQKT
jgi:hypothetical protein